MKNLFVDFDETITYTIEAFCKTYNKVYCNEPNFIPADPLKVNDWDFSTQCSLLKGDDKLKIFEHDYLFEDLKFFPNAKEVLEELSEDFNIIICTIGTFLSISKKTQWINDNLPKIKDGIFIKNRSKGFDKSIVDMRDGIFIDDHEQNLITSNAELKICFGNEYKWNESWNGIRAKDWLEVKRIILENK